MKPRGERVLHPAPEHRAGLRVEVGLGQPAEGVLLAQGGGARRPVVVLAALPVARAAAAGQGRGHGVPDERGGERPVLLDPAPSVATNRRVRDRKPAEEMVVIVEDLIKLLDSVSESLRRGHYPDKAHGNKVAQVLHAVAGDLEL